jgi:hypothetical protein
MVAHFVRRLVGGVATFLGATLLIYTLLMYSPEGVVGEMNRVLDRFRSNPDIYGYYGIMYVAYDYNWNKPWPENYLLWLFDPKRTERLDLKEGELKPTGINVQLLGMQLQGSGLLTGEFGSSIAVAQGQPVSQLYGINPPFLLAVTLIPTFILMLVAILQRRGRPSVYGFIPPESPAKAVWLRAELWPLG